MSPKMIYLTYFQVIESFLFDLYKKNTHLFLKKLKVKTSISVRSRLPSLKPKLGKWLQSRSRNQGTATPISSNTKYDVGPGSHVGRRLLIQLSVVLSFQSETCECEE